MPMPPIHRLLLLLCLLLPLPAAAADAAVAAQDPSVAADNALADELASLPEDEAELPEGYEELPETADPLEPLNRGIYRFNDTLDRYLLRPVAVGYQTVTPQPVRKGVNNFFFNLFTPITIVNDLLQGEFSQGASDTGRFLFNSTFGLLGLFDVADEFLGLERHKTDLGLTFGEWGIGTGWYLVLPLLGPSNSRDLVGRLGDGLINPLGEVDDYETRLGLVALSTVDGRAQFLGEDKLLDDTLDPYLFIREAYMQRRNRMRSVSDVPIQDGMLER